MLTIALACAGGAWLWWQTTSGTRVLRELRPTVPPGAASTVRAWYAIPDLPQPIAQFQTVFWEPDDTQSLRAWIAQPEHMQAKRVLEIGPGTGLLSLCCLAAGAREVLAIDVNPAAVANTRYNAMQLGWNEQVFQVRLLDDPRRSPMSEVAPGRVFDVILSNPPWEDATIESVDQYALYDPGFALCQSLLQETSAHLALGGKLLLVYGAKTAIRYVLDHAPAAGWHVKILDSREFEQLDEVFLPGMLLELTRSP